VPDCSTLHHQGQHPLYRFRDDGDLVQAIAEVRTQPFFGGRTDSQDRMDQETSLTGKRLMLR
jgi:hypothetical protein